MGISYCGVNILTLRRRGGDGLDVGYSYLVKRMAYGGQSMNIEQRTMNIDEKRTNNLRHRLTQINTDLFATMNRRLEIKKILNSNI